MADQRQTRIGQRLRDEVERIISDESLRADEARDFVAGAFRNGRLTATGTAIARALAPTSRLAGEPLEAPPADTSR